MSFCSSVKNFYISTDYTVSLSHADSADFRRARTLRLRLPSGGQHTCEAMYASAYSLHKTSSILHSFCENLRSLREI